MSHGGANSGRLGLRLLIASPIALGLTVLGLWLLDAEPAEITLAGRTLRLDSGVRETLGLGEIAAGQLVFLRFVADACFPAAPRRLRLGAQGVLVLVVAGAAALLGMEVWRP